MFQLRVSGNNLTNVCRLVFKVAKEEKNDNFFLEDNLLGKYVLFNNWYCHNEERLEYRCPRSP